MAINKVVFGGSTLIDITDTTATASDVLNGKYFYAADGSKVQGTAVSSVISVVESQDSGGGTIISISGNTSNLITKTITENGTYEASDDDADGYSEVTVNVSGGTLPYLLDHVEYTLVTDATSESRQAIQLTAVGSSPYVLFLTPKVVPAAPSSGYTAYNWVRADMKVNSTLMGSIIRADGTTGTDQNMAGYTPSTGVLLIGGQWGTFRTGQVFDIYLFILT